MTKRIDNLLRQKNLATDGALHTKFKTGFGTGWLFSSKCFLCVSKSLAFGFATDGASFGSSAGCICPTVSICLAFGYAADGAGLGSGTGCCCPGVSESSDFCLCNRNLAADGALLTFGQTGFGTGCSFAGNGFLGMTESSDLFLRDSNLVADRTLLTVCQTSFGTGCSLAGNGFLGVRKLI